MKRTRLVRLIGVILCLILLFALPVFSLADAGNFSGGSDYGGSSGGDSWGGSSSWGSDYSSGGYYYSDGGDSSGDGGGGFFIFLIIGAIVLFLYFKNKGKMNAASQSAGTATVAGAAQGALKPVSALLTDDPEFSENELKEKISNLYMKLQDAWEGKAWEPMRAHMTDELYNQFARQLDEYIRNHQTNHVDRIAVLGVELRGVRQDEVNDAVIARVKSRIVDYVVDDNTGALISGSKTKELFMEYEWTLIRSRGVKTEHSDNPETVHCANCGAPLEISYSAKCGYCGSVTVNSQYDWVISAIKGISQRSA